MGYEKEKATLKMPAYMVSALKKHVAGRIRDLQPSKGQPYAKDAPV